MGDIVSRQNELNEKYVPGWKDILTVADYEVQIIDEAAELLGSGIEYKWWSDCPADRLNIWNAKIEVIDMVFFGASIVNLTASEGNLNFLFDVSLQEAPLNGAAALHSVNKLKSDVFMGLVKSGLMLGTSQAHSVKNAVDFFDHATNSLGFTDEEFSAMYMAKWALNEFRISSDYKSGKYQKVKDGVEDNERMRIIVEDFLNDETKTLDDVYHSVVKTFFALK